MGEKLRVITCRNTISFKMGTFFNLQHTHPGKEHPSHPPRNLSQPAALGGGGGGGGPSVACRT